MNIDHEILTFYPKDIAKLIGINILELYSEDVDSTIYKVNLKELFEVSVDCLGDDDVEFIALLFGFAQDGSLLTNPHIRVQFIGDSLKSIAALIGKCRGFKHLAHAESGSDE